MIARLGLVRPGLFLAASHIGRYTACGGLAFQQDSPPPSAGHGKRNPRGRRCSALAEQDSPPMPPLNATLWMLLIASLVALFGWGVVRLTGRIERQRRTHGMTKDSR